MKSTALTTCSVMILSVCLNGVAATKPTPEVKTTPPTKAGILALAEQCLQEVTPQLSIPQKSAVDRIRFTLDAQRTVPAIQAQSIDELVNHCTIALANTDGIEATIATSVYLLQSAPANARVANLFGVVLHTIGRNAEAIAALEYARTLRPKSELIMLNAANTYLDLDEDEKAKTLIDQVLAQNATNKSAYSALACYWYKQGDLQKTLEALMKSASFGGGVVQKKAEENQKVVEENTVSGDDPIETMEQKLAGTKDLVPKTTADLIEDQFPDAAKQIRDRYGRLVDNEKMILPPLPQLNTSGLKNWTAKGAPYIKRWQDAFDFNAENAMYEIGHLEAGINRGDSEAVIKQKSTAVMKPRLQKAMTDTEKMLKMMEGMPGVSAEQLKKARASLRQAEKELGVKPPPAAAESDESPAITSDADAEKIGAEDVLPGSDYGSAFAATNYRDFLVIRNGYELYFLKYYQEFSAKVQEILSVYDKKNKEEQSVYAANMQKIDEEEIRVRKAAGGALDRRHFELEQRKETLRYRKAVNRLGDDYFAQWANLALPQYVQKMKPKLDEYWAVCGLYIRNMNQPEVMKAEYVRVKQNFWLRAGIAVGSMSVGDNTFTYLGETDKEEQELEADIRAAEEEAKAKLEDYKQETKTADNAIVKWLEDNFALGIAGEFLSLKITPRRLTIEEYIAGMNFKHVLDFKTGQWTTYRSFAAKIDIGIQIGPMKAGVSARADILESYDTLNIRTGQVINSGSRFVAGSAGGAIGAGDVTIGGSAQVTLDPAAENEVSVKFTHSLGAKNKLYQSPDRKGEKVDIGGSAP